MDHEIARAPQTTRATDRGGAEGSAKVTWFLWCACFDLALAPACVNVLKENEERACKEAKGKKISRDGQVVRVPLELARERRKMRKRNRRKKKIGVGVLAN